MTTRRTLIVGMAGAGIGAALAGTTNPAPPVKLEEAKDLPFEEISNGLRVDLSEVSFTEALIHIDNYNGKRRWEYTLTVPPSLELDAKKLLRTMGARLRNNPIAPFVNLRVDHTEVMDGTRRSEYWWYIKARDVTGAPLNPPKEQTIVRAGSLGAV